MMDITVDDKQVEKTIERFTERNIILPTFAQMKDASLIPKDITEKLAGIGLWDVNPLNLFRISWKNDVESGGFNGVNYLEIPPELSGIETRIIALVGKWFPTGAHKVGAAYGCLAPRLVTGEFDPINEKAVWPSTGNYCRGGAYVSSLMGCHSVAILPEEMSKERFEWLKSIGSEVIATPGCESNVKEIYDKCWELRRSGDALTIFNQFDEFGNPLWHYEVTGHAIEEVLTKEMRSGDRYFGYAVATGSAGTIGAGEYLKERYPTSKVIASEALQCPTLLMNGFGAHRIEGIGDKHVPWVHNVKNTDMIIAMDDAPIMNVMRLFNEEAGRKLLADQGVTQELLDKLPLLGISSISNMMTCIKAAKYYELGGNDIMFTIFTDSMAMYQSRLAEQTAQNGPFSRDDAILAFHRGLHGLKTDFMKELDHYDRKRIHNLKYFTWIEQQGRELAELNAQWNDRNYWNDRWHVAERYDALIDDFNKRTGLLG